MFVCYVENGFGVACSEFAAAVVDERDKRECVWPFRLKDAWMKAED